MLRRLIFFNFMLTKFNVITWNLQTYDDIGSNSFTNNEYTIEHVSVFYVRAFLTIRSLGNSTNRITSIIESTWPENLLPVQSRVFPNDLSHAKIPFDCNTIVQTVQTAVDRSNGQLWLLDNGSIYCAPKLIIFDLLRGNSEVHRYVFNELKNASFNGVQLQHLLDKDEENNMIPSIGTRGIISLYGKNYLLIYSLPEGRLRKLRLVIKNSNTSRTLLSPREVVMKDNNELLISDFFNSLWLANLNQLKSFSKKKRNNNEYDSTIEVKYVGSLLGSSRALAIPKIIDAEQENYLYYYLPRDGAILRWNLKRLLTAEAHDVLHLTQLPVAQIVFGAKGSVWLVYEHANEFGDHCRRILSFTPFNGARMLL